MARYFPARPVAKRDIYLGVGRSLDKFRPLLFKKYESVAGSSSKNVLRNTGEGIFETVSHVARPVRIFKAESLAAGNLCLSTQTPEIENDRTQRPKHSMQK